MIDLMAATSAPTPQARRIEKTAADVLARCKNALGLQAIPFPIPIERWVEHPLGYTLAVSDLSNLGADVLGATFVEENEIAISERLEDDVARFRFTVAHELGHLQLHAEGVTHFRETESVGPGSPIRIERQADRFAAAFLMPMWALMAEVLFIFDHYDLDRVRCSGELSIDTPESIWLWKRRILPSITDTFEVSLSAAINRFMDIRCDDGRPLMPASHKKKLLSADPDRVFFRTSNGFLQRVQHDHPTLF